MDHSVRCYEKYYIIGLYSTLLNCEINIDYDFNGVVNWATTKEISSIFLNSMRWKKKHVGKWLKWFAWRNLLLNKNKTNLDTDKQKKKIRNLQFIVVCKHWLPTKRKDMKRAHLLSHSLFALYGREYMRRTCDLLLRMVQLFIST